MAAQPISPTEVCEDEPVAELVGAAVGGHRDFN